MMIKVNVILDKKTNLFYKLLSYKGLHASFCFNKKFISKLTRYVVKVFLGTIYLKPLLKKL